MGRTAGKTMNVLVTGGGGFLGSAIIRQLLPQGCQVTSLSRSLYPELESLGVRQVQGDLADKKAVLQAAENAEIIYHVAAKAGIWGNYDAFYKANVTGTRNIITACKELGINRLIYTSSPSVVFDGKDVWGGDESLPYPTEYLAHYPKTKAMAEQMVIASNSPELATVSLRPHLIWGPGDNHLVPRIIDKARKGRLRRIGQRNCLVDTVYIDNAAKAHLLAAERLAPGNQLAGKVYFITNAEPIELWEMVNRILAAAQLPPITKSILPETAWLLGNICEKIWSWFNLKDEPPMTRFVARELSTAHWFNISAAEQDLGYQPEVSIDEGLQQLADWLQENSKTYQP